MKQILVITKADCVACGYYINGLKAAVDDFNSSVQNTDDIVYIKTVDYYDVDTQFIINNRIKEFPTSLYMDDDVVKFKCAGSVPQAVIYRYIQLYLGNK
jgi:hypothetical protein